MQTGSRPLREERVQELFSLFHQRYLQCHANRTCGELYLRLNYMTWKSAALIGFDDYLGMRSSVWAVLRVLKMTMFTFSRKGVSEVPLYPNRIKVLKCKSVSRVRAV